KVWQENRETSFSSGPKMMDIDANEVDLYLRFNRDISFNERLFLLIDRTGQRDSDVYKKARIDRRLFSKIRSNKKYIPCKKTVIALCLALELNREETDQLLSSAGYSLSSADDYDLAIAFFIDKKVYDFFDINDVLAHFGFDVF
ncbi:MAG: RNase III inhibitor, partial [Acutalibacteraceae bacterium]